MKHLLVASLAVTLMASAVVAADKPADNSIYSPMPASTVREHVLSWLDAQKSAKTDVLAQARQSWEEGDLDLSATELMEKAVATFAMVDPAAKTLVDQSEIKPGSKTAADEAYEDLDLSNEFFASQMQLFYGRSLAQRKMYDEALFVFDETDAKTVIDPASLLFHKACAEHQLFMKEEGTKSVAALLKNTEDVPARYRQVASLMEYDFAQMKEETLGHVASKMNDSERRLELSRSGQRVQKVQGEIIILLDDIIEKLEQQAQMQPGSGKPGTKPGNTNESSAPADESMVKGAPGEGEVDEKTWTNNRNRWGKLPKAEAVKAANIINKNMPSYYKDVIEGYAERLAKHKVKTAGDSIAEDE